MHNALHLARLHIGSLYQRDARGRIVRVREPDPAPPPRFHLVRTAKRNIPLVSARMPDGVASELLALAKREPALGDPAAPPLYAERYAEVLSEHELVRERHAGPAFVLPVGGGPPAGATRISTANSTLLATHFSWALPLDDAHAPVWAVVQDCVAVAICFSAREPSEGTEVGVVTIEAYRGRGYGRRVVSAWAREIGSRGRVPLYSTAWGNLASRRIAESLGGELYAADFWVR